MTKSLENPCTDKAYEWFIPVFLCTYSYMFYHSSSNCYGELHDRVQ